MDLKNYKKHQKIVSTIQKKLNESVKEVALGSSKASNTLRDGASKKGRTKLDFSNLNSILEINEKECFALVEPRVTFFKLVSETLKRGLIPLVVPEFKTITIGGAIMGAALESSSHKCGQFNDTCLEYELLLGDGTLLKASPQEHSDLFFGVAGSYGTLAFLTLAKVQLKKASPHVHLVYHSYTEKKEFFDHLKKENNAEYLEGVAFSEKEYVVIEGFPGTFKKPRRAHFFSPWYYQKIQKKCPVLTLKDYLFRFDRGAFWMGRYVASPSFLLRSLFSFGVKDLANQVKMAKPKNPSFLLRLLFGWAFTSHSLYKIWHKVPLIIIENLFFIHDFYVPCEKLDAAFNSMMTQTNIFPVWLCPIKGTKEPQLLSPHFGNVKFVNIGIYGIPKTSTISDLSLKLEREVFTFGGRKMLYSLTYYSEEEFEKNYPMKNFEELRTKYGANTRLTPFFQKIRR